jgi:hypothetical protein
MLYKHQTTWHDSFVMKGLTMFTRFYTFFFGSEEKIVNIILFRFAHTHQPIKTISASYLILNIQYSYFINLKYILINVKSTQIAIINKQRINNKLYRHTI